MLVPEKSNRAIGYLTNQTIWIFIRLYLVVSLVDSVK
jgi:hypothetical protein